jgi:peptidoglycan/xylan/chitin deacetylase (PgdA/CDA1 family)
MKMPMQSKLRSLTQTLRLRRTSQALILMYHRIADIPSDPHLLAVTPQHFAEQLAVVCKYGRPMRLGELCKGLSDHTARARAVVITLDDGYADSLYFAKPLLERFDVPATVFATTGYPGREQEFWWDELDRLLLQPGLLPATLQLTIKGIDYEWELGAAASYSNEDYERLRCWNMKWPEDPTQRHRLFRVIYQLLLPLREQERQEVVQGMRAWAQAAAEVRMTHRVLTPDELAWLDASGLVEVGAHTVTHPMLAKLPIGEQLSEIKQSKAFLEEVLGRPVTSFSYPHGSYAPSTVEAVRASSFTSACSSTPAPVGSKSDPLQLPRVEVRNWDATTFARHITTWLTA